MRNTIDIPTVDVPIGADFLFKASQVYDLLNLITDFSAATFTITVYRGAYPSTGTTIVTITGQAVSGSEVDLYGIFKDTDMTGLSNGDVGWASFSINAGTDALGKAALKLRFVKV